MTAAPLFAEVAVALPLDTPLTYAVPEPLRARIELGVRVRVPVRGRTETGYVVALTSATAFEKTLPIREVLDDAPVISAELLELTRWMSDYYCCSWGEAIQAALPSGLNIKRTVHYRLILDAVTEGRFSERQKQVVGELHRRGPTTAGTLAKALGERDVSTTLRGLVARGIVAEECISEEQSVSIQTETYAVLNEAAVPAPEALAAMQRRAPRQAAVYLDLLNNEPQRAATDLYARHDVDRTILKALEAKGLVALEERPFYRMTAHPEAPNSAAKHVLNDEQGAAYNALLDAMEARRFQTFLLMGITGSGKTEVYLQAIERALELGRSAIMLVPEISLTPQTVGRFKARFKTNIAVLHSGLGAGERYDEWRRAKQGEVRIVVGARSAVFAPLPDVGILIVDEEHDHSYKQSDTPRYHARDVAIMRAMMQRAVCVLGSATPSIESYYNSENGKSQRLELLRRATNATLPEVEIVDMRAESREHGGTLILSPRLEQEVHASVARGEQAILLLNRRGFAPFVLCPGCGHVANCLDCNVSMTYHERGAFMLCHYCNTRRGVPQACDECGFSPLLFLGTGTQKAEDYLVQAFPEARVARMDADTTSGKGGHAKILGRFAQGEIDILIGTQMIAKGHDYPGVTIVGVINADTGLSLPDFRAAENTFQLLTQVAGRAGRGASPGKVILQTFRPNHYAVQAAARHDYAEFYGREIGFRESAGYPPLRRMAHLAVEAEDPLVAERSAAVVSRLVRRRIEEEELRGCAVLGPSPAVVRRVMRRYRWNLALLAAGSKRLNALVRAVREQYRDDPNAQAPLKVDLDPYGMY